MKLLTYKEKNNSSAKFGFKVESQIIDISRAAKWVNENQNNDDFLLIPNTLKEALIEWNKNFSLLKQLEEIIINTDLRLFSKNESDLVILPPIPDPPAFRDFYAFEQHVRAARKLRGLEMNPDWYKLAIFYFSNPNCCYGHGADIPYPSNTTELDLN